MSASATPTRRFLGPWVSGRSRISPRKRSCVYLHMERQWPSPNLGASRSSRKTGFSESSSSGPDSSRNSAHVSGNGKSAGGGSSGSSTTGSLARARPTFGSFFSAPDRSKPSVGLRGAPICSIHLHCSCFEDRPVGEFNPLHFLQLASLRVRDEKRRQRTPYAQ